MKKFTLFSMKKLPLVFGLLLAFSAAGFASIGEAPKITFEQNKNQLPRKVKYSADIPGGKLFLEQNTFTYLYEQNMNFHETHMNNESRGPIHMKFHSFKVNFENSNADAEISGNNLLETKRNYYIGNDERNWASNVPLYTEVYYKNMYNNIDVKAYNQEANFKYDFIVHPGANPNNIKLNYTGTDGMRIENGHLYIKTSLYDLIEQKPFAYQVINGLKTEVACAYILKNNTITFDLAAYDRSVPLIIDPTLIAATYSGSLADNWGFTATYDAAGNIYIAGIVSNTGYPATAGAWDQTWNGGMPVNFSPGTWPFDISISKFNPTGSTLIYATYYGGSANEQPHSIIVNGANELYVVGRTNSANFPTTAGAYDQTQNGGYDIIVGRFGPTGALLGSTFVGGSGDDCVSISIDWSIYTSLKYNYTDDGRSEIILDGSSNVYIAANTRSVNFPTTVNAYKAGGSIGGAQDAVVIKLSSTLNALMFSTLLGGTGDDAAYGLKLDNSNNIYVTGGTASNNFPTTAGVLHTTFQGGVADAFVSVFNPAAVGPAQLLRSTYLGTAAFDQAYLLEIDASGDIYVFGQTKGAYPVSAGVYSNPNSGQFIHKITGNLQSTVFSTVIGKGALTPNISPTAFLVDSCQTIYIAGWGRGCTLDNTMDCSNSACVGLPLTANAIQSTTDGVDFYFAVLAPNAKALWYATFYGENTPAQPTDHVDGGTSRFDKRGVIYEACCASCGGTQNFPTTPTAFCKINQGAVPPNGYGIFGNNCNEAVIKMDVGVKPLAVASLTGPSNGCAPFNVSFNNAGSSATDFIWDFGDGSAIDTNKSPSHTYINPGHWIITLYAIDSIGICGYVDTAIVAINVGAPPALVTAGTNVLCAGGNSGSATATASGGLAPLTYSWNTTPVQTTTTATGLSGGTTYIVTVKDSLGCASTGSVNISAPPILSLTTTPTGTSCGKNGGSACVSTTGGTPGYTYSWNTTPVQITSCANGIGSGAYVVTVTDAHGCTSTKPVNVPAINGPTVTAAPFGAIKCNGSKTGSASSGMANGTPPYTYSWNTTPVQTTAIATGLGAGTYTITITDSKGCSAQDIVTLVDPPPITIATNAQDLNCSGDNSGATWAVPSGGTGPNTYTYQWNTTPVQTGQGASGLPAGTYSVLVTDKNGCTATKGGIVISQPLALGMTTTTTGSLCGSSTGTAGATATGGTPGYTYTWNNAQNTWNTQNITGIPGGSYTVVVTDSHGCTKQDTAFVASAVQPFAAFSYTPSLTCDGVSVQFKDSSQNATAWDWYFGDQSPHSNQQNPVHVFPYTGTYVVVLSAIKPPCNSIATQTITVGGMLSYANFTEANVFSPNNDGQNDCFHPRVLDPKTGKTVDALLPCIELEVFDRWGVKMFESIGANGSNCWDGNNYNDSKPALDGTYYYVAKLAGTTLKGYVTLVSHK